MAAKEHINNDGSRQHVLLTALGISPRPTVYSLNAETAKAEHVPLALLYLLPAAQRPDTVYCLITQRAREVSWPSFSRQARQLGVTVEAIDIPDADRDEDITEIIHRVSQRLPADTRLILDITHGPRHIPFVFYALALYLSSFRGVEIVGVWYGKLESQGTSKPLLNLRSLLHLPQWFYAARLFREAGLIYPLAQRFDAVRAGLPQGPERGPLHAGAKALHKFADHYQAGFPLELGLAAGKLCHTLRAKPLEQMSGLNVPLVKELEQEILDAVAPLRLASEDLREGKESGEWKKNYLLTQTELQRQARLIDQYLAHGQLALGVRLMREWVVSLGALHRGLAACWLDYASRRKVERELGAMMQPSLQVYLHDEQKLWASFWNQLSDLRNQLAHHGMKEQVAKVGVDSIRPVWDEVKTADRAWDTFGGGQGRLLVTPLGLSPGVLYSAIRWVGPDSVVVVSSEKAKADLDEALRRTQFSGACETLVMQDPFNGADEIEGMKQQARQICLNADEVLANLTGGTTLMGVVVQTLCEQARDDQRPCWRFGLTDKRSLEKQKQNPWIESELFWLDKKSGGAPSDA